MKTKLRKSLLFNSILSIIVISIGIYLRFSEISEAASVMFLALGGGLFGIFIHRIIKKEIISDELTEWAEGKAAYFTFWASIVIIAILITYIEYKQNIVDVVGVLLILAISMLLIFAISFAYFEKIKRMKGR